MGELIKKIIGFFEDKAISLSKKMVVLILICISVFLVDNSCGFSYYFVQSCKLNYITSLENARLKYAEDKVVSQELDRMMVNAINRWTVYNAISDIFQKTFSTTSEAREQKLVEELAKDKNKKIEKGIDKKNEKDDSLLLRLFPVADRSPFWHTVCSSLFFIIILLICLFYILLSPFIHDANKKNALIGMCFLISFLIGAIFFIQWILSFIPDIDNRPRINYLIYICLNIIITIMLIKKTGKNKYP